MNLEKYLNYATNHSESIIQWTFLTILILAGIIIARSLFGTKSSPESGGAKTAAMMPDLQEALDKIMAQMSKLEVAPLKEMSPAAVADVDAQVQELKKELSSREAELTQLKAAGPSKATEDASALSARIKELEAKLSEYEILEDDIADLSLYKEENTRLRAELEKVKGGAVVSAAPAQVPSPAPQTGEAIVAEFAQAVSHEPATAAVDPVAEAASVSIPDTGNPMADFESTVELERTLTGGGATAPAPAVPAPAPVAAKPAVAQAPADPAAPPAEADDLFAEFANAPVSDEENSTLDTEKMMAEMAALVSIEPAQGNALEESMDLEKMASEAKGS